MTEIIRHGKVTKAYRSSLRPPSQADFDTLLSATLSTLINAEADVLVSFPYTLKFPESFPRGVLVQKNPDGSNTHRVKAAKLLKWLNQQGYTEATTEMLGESKEAFTKMQNRIENLLDV